MVALHNAYILYIVTIHVSLQLFLAVSNIADEFVPAYEKHLREQGEDELPSLVKCIPRGNNFGYFISSVMTALA